MIQLRMLGRLALTSEDGASMGAVLNQPKRFALLAYLAAVHPPADSSRDTLIALLWPELDESRARTGLRQALHGLRRVLGARVFTGAGDERVGLDTAHFWCDVSAFRAELREGNAEAALALYQGPFLDGFHVADAPDFERWVDRERRRLEQAAVGAAWRLVEAAQGAGDPAAARRWAERALELAPYEETGFRRYLKVLEQQGDGAAAMSAAAAFRRSLSQDLGLEPSAATADAIDAIRSWRGPVRTDPLPADKQQRSAPADPTAPVTVATAPAYHARRGKRWLLAAFPLVLLIAGALAAARWIRGDSTPTRPAPTSIAVLPFRNLSADSADAYFAAGLHDELLSRLSSVSTLRVVGRTSVAGYQHSTKSLPAIAEELMVGSVVEGSVQIAGNRLRVVVQLLDPVTQEELWVERYDRTIDDALAVQQDIAERIVAAVGATLSGAEADALRTVPTRSASAYEQYLRGLEYSRRPGLRSENDMAAAELFERAIALDSAFAPARAALALVHWRIYALRIDRSPTRLAAAQREADMALRLAPGLPEGHLAVGLARYMNRSDFRGALRQFRLGLRAAPNHAELWNWVGNAHRHVGEWDSVAVAYERARSIEPRSANLYFSIGNTNHYLHRYPEAIAAYRRAAVLAPDFTQARLSLAWSYVLWQGQLDTLRAVLATLPRSGDAGGGGGDILFHRLIIAQIEGRPDSVLANLSAVSDPLARAGFAATAHTKRGEHAVARAFLDTALAIVDQRLLTAPDDVGLHGERGVLLGKLGHRQAALREAQWLEQSDDYRKNRFTDGLIIAKRSVVLLHAGATDAALAEIERSLAQPSWSTVHWLRMDANFDPIRNDPRFQALLVKYRDPLLK